MTKKVLIAVGAYWEPRLADSLLWRSEIERVRAPAAAQAVEAARALKPRLILLDGEDPATLAALRALRQDEATRAVSTVVLLRSGDAAALRASGANDVLLDEDQPRRWEDCFEKLLSIPPRQDLRVPITLAVSSRKNDQASGTVVGESVNVSVAGLLVETPGPMPPGEMLDIALRLPGGEGDVRLVGKVIWCKPTPTGRHRSGILFRRFHGGAMEALMDLFYRPDAGPGATR